MRRSAFILATCLASLGLAASASAHPETAKTTNPGGYVTVRVVVTDQGVKMQPARAPRGTTAIFLLSNVSKSSRVFSVGDASLKHRRGTGFAVQLKQNERKRVLLYLTYRGPLPSAVGDVQKSKVVDVFWVT